MERTIKGRQIIYTVRKPIEARLATFEVKRQAEQFYIDAERRREEKSNRRAEKKAAARHAVGAKFFGKDYQPHADWVRQNPLPSAHELFSDVRPTSTLISPNRKPLIRTISTQTEVPEIITQIQTSITPVTSVQREPTVPPSKVSSSDLVPIKLTRHQGRKLRQRKFYEENPEAPSLLSTSSTRRKPCSRRANSSTFSRPKATSEWDSIGRSQTTQGT